MSFNLPDGSKLFISTGIGASLPVTAATNGNPCVATSTAHGLVNGDIFVFTSGWEDANDSVFRVSGASTNSFNVEGLDTTDSTWFSAGSGTGSVAKVTGWQEIQQVTNLQMSGGDPKYATVQLLSRRRDINLPAGFNASNMTITLADDPTLPGQIALSTASRTTAKRAFKVSLTGGGFGYFWGYVAFNDMPSLNKGQANSVQGSITILGSFIRYSS